MPSCVFRKCNTYTGPAVKCKKDVSFHLFPKDGLMKEKWVQVVRTQRREDDWMPTTYSTICSQHFLESDKYVTKKNVRKLIKTAVPVIKHKENLGEGIISDNDSLKDVYISDHDSAFDTPREAYLKKKITKINQAKKSYR
ncbi:THAP domain-containing protein 2-like [Helicoverpa zea]|uniref:THAP domain-containing protein 2-like n=1 Tax=Helicoverpa zea TaxID=7113 RepID=UPI001F588DD5|nr:THAP domain-containing protein 2-like [Helicoverpa zea]